MSPVMVISSKYRGHEALTSVLYSESARLEPGPEKSNLNAFGNVLHQLSMLQDCTSQITYSLRIFCCSPFVSVPYAFPSRYADFGCD
jgi:hypothetical protein